MTRADIPRLLLLPLVGAYAQSSTKPEFEWRR